MAKAANSKDSLVHAQPPTFAQCWAEHRECAGHLKKALILPGVMCALRYAWAGVHVGVVKPVCDGLQWVLFSPLRFAVTAIVLFLICWFA